MTQWYVLLLLAVVGGWVVQLYFTYRQSTAFMADVRELRQHGLVSIGIGGKRYRGGRAYVAMAVQDGAVTKAITLHGWTTFARAQPLTAMLAISAAGMHQRIRWPRISNGSANATRCR